MIFEQILIALPLVIGAYITLSLLKLPDFSIESSYLCGAVAAFFAKDLPMPLTVLCALFGGMISGSIVFAVHQFGRLPFILAAIVTNGFFHGFTQLVLKAPTKNLSTSLSVLENSIIVLLLVIVLALTLRSQLGYSFAIYGNNFHFFKNHAISEKYCLFMGLIIGHGFCGVSGYLFAQSCGFIDLSMNVGIILLCLTSLILGKIFIKSHRPLIILPILGCFLFFMMQSLLLRLGLNLKYFNAFQALIVLVVIYFGFRNRNLSLNHLGV